MILTSAKNDILRAFRASGETPTEFTARLDKPGWMLLGGTWTPNTMRHARRVLARLVYLDATKDCGSCGQPGTTPHECPKAERPCGHHCNHSWEQDECCWCGATFTEQEPQDSGPSFTP